MYIQTKTYYVYILFSVFVFSLFLFSVLGSKESFKTNLYKKENMAKKIQSINHEEIDISVIKL